MPPETTPMPPELRDPAKPWGLTALRQFVIWYWRETQCWICGRFGHCPHREVEVDIARALAWSRELWRARQQMLPKPEAT